MTLQIELPEETGAPSTTSPERPHYDTTMTPKKADITLDEGVKYDGEKVRYDLIPADALHELAKVYTMGAQKYDDRNWEKGMSWCRVFGAMMRHAWAWMRGERCDPEDGQPHMASVAWCALALLSYETRDVGKDDRPNGN